MVARSEPAAARRRGEWWLLDRLALGSALLSGLVMYALIAEGGWYIDDFQNLILAQLAHLNRPYVDLPIFGHPQPGTRIVTWLLYRVAPMNYQLAAGLVCLGLALGAYLFYRILRLAFRPSPWHLVLTSMVVSTGLWVPVSAWWAGAVELIPCFLTGMLMTYSVLRCYQGGRARWLWGVLPGVWLLGGLAFYERALFGGMFAALFLPAVAATSFRPRAVLQVARRAWLAYASLIVVALAYLAYYTSHQLVRTVKGYTKAELLHFFWVCWSHSLIPGLFGGSIGSVRILALSTAHPPLWWLVVCQFALLGLVVLGVLRNGARTLLAWAVFVVLFFLPAQYAIATARLKVHGPAVGQEYRYVADLLPLLLLTVALVVLRRGSALRTGVASAGPVPAEASPAEGADAAAVGAPAAAAAPHPPVRTRPTLLGLPRPHLVLTVAALCALWAVFLSTALPIHDRWVHGRNVRYAKNLRHDVAMLDRGAPWSVYNTFVPVDVSSPTYGRYSTVPAIAELLSRRQISVDDLSRPMYVADANGHLRPARFYALSTAADVCSTTRQRILTPLSRPLPKGLWNIQFKYSTRYPTTMRFAMDPGNGTPIEATGLFRGFPVRAGSGELTFALRQSSITQFRLDAATGGVCLSDIRIGRPVPVAR